MFIFITSTSSRMTWEQTAQMGKFLEAFLPGKRKFPGAPTACLLTFMAERIINL